MKKKMFNDKYGLTDAVLECRKTMWRSVFDYETYRKLWEDMCRLGTPCFDTFDDFLIKRKAHYKVGEVVAVAQPYKVLDYSLHGFATNPSRSCGIRKEYAEKQKGWSNKMLVESKFMPHQIKITDIKVERLQDISEEDAMKEGIYVSDTFTKYGIRNGYSPQCANDPKEKNGGSTHPETLLPPLSTL